MNIEAQYENYHELSIIDSDTGKKLMTIQTDLLNIPEKNKIRLAYIAGTIVHLIHDTLQKPKPPTDRYAGVTFNYVNRIDMTPYTESMLTPQQ